MVVFLHFYHQIEEIRTLLFKSVLGVLLIVISVFLIVFRFSFYLYLIYKYLNYKPIINLEDRNLPSCTIIVPAFNEGKFVYDTLISISESNYPLSKLQLLVIDDGSTDNTFSWIEKAKKQLGEKLTVYRQIKNSGKKKALYEGIIQATGEILITIDSDSIVEKNTIRNLVAPFVNNDNCGVVAGNVKVYNIDNAIFPKMLNVSFAYNFEFIRAAQSKMNSVLCSPGALSAYRTSVVKTCLNDWINQTFLGVKTKIGEDRALTNLILKSGYDSVFQSNAIVYTKVPEIYHTLKNMFVRWERGDIRENIIMFGYVFTKFRLKNLLDIRIVFLNQWFTTLLSLPFFLIMLISCLYYPRLFISSSILTATFISVFPSFFYGINFSLKKSIWIFPYNLFYTFFLFWIVPYSIFTVKKGNWLTR
jgi:hyaluronan synthase